MQNLIIFNATNVRGDVASGEPWFALIDVCRVLDIRDVKQVGASLKDKYKRVVALHAGAKGKRRIVCINKIGCYRLIMRSNSPVAEAFQDEIYDYVIPAYLDEGAVINPRITPEQLKAHKEKIADLERRLDFSERIATAFSRAIHRKNGYELKWDSSLDIAILNGVKHKLNRAALANNLGEGETLEEIAHTCFEAVE